MKGGTTVNDWSWNGKVELNVWPVGTKTTAVKDGWKVEIRVTVHVV
jgi:hypothetical protein